MKGSKENGVEELENIIRALADVWPADRENVAKAGAGFEEFVQGFDKDVGQLQKLIDLAWEGLKYLYEQDEFFMSVKAATMQAVNTIREYLIKDGDIQIEDFEKACTDLEKALSGGGESADTVIEVKEEQQPEQEELQSKTTPTLNDLAASVMAFDAGAATKEDWVSLITLIKRVIESTGSAVAAPLKEALEAVGQWDQEPGNAEDLVSLIAGKVEVAVEVEADEKWNDETPDGADRKKSPEAKELEEEVFIIPDDIDVTMTGEFITECTDLLNMAEGALLDLEESPEDEELINQIFRSFHTIKGTSAFMGLDPISDFTHLLETLLSTVREGELNFTTACADISLESIDVIKQMLEAIETAKGGDPLPRPSSYGRLTKILKKISNEGVEPEVAFSQEPRWDSISISQENTSAEKGKPEQRSSNSPSNGTVKENQKMPENSGGKSKTESSVRVNVGRLDRLIDMIGELVIAHSVVAQDSAIPNHSELQKKVNHTTKILRELQDTSLTLRMVPLKATFQKMNRLVRDLSRKAGKSVNLTTFGEDTEIDRNMVDVISEPLVHMIRNAIDHGIEGPEEREESGKPSKAIVSLRASQEGGLVLIEIEDDGRGINKKKVLQKAIDKGLVDPEEKLTDSEIFKLIFLPGFSSVDKVTDLSGRGVGMDVVRKSIEQLQGKIDITSEKGHGTKISLELPFTLAITDGMLVNVGDQQFIVPTINIDMAFRAKKKDIFTVMGNNEKVSFRGQSVPVVRLHQLFDVPGGAENLMEGTLLVIRNGSKKYALLVDEVVGQQQLVGKSINMMAKMDHISGGAILGDGRVGLILDTAALMN